MVMDAQNSFLSKEGSVYMGEKAEILKIRIIDYLSNFNKKRIFFREKHIPQDSFFVMDKTHSVATMNDFKIAKDVKSCADIFMDKTRYNAFFKTDLESILSREKANHIGLMGVETHTSVLFTSEELRNRGFEVTVIEPCTMARDDYMHSSALSIMRNFLGVRIGD